VRKVKALPVKMETDTLIDKESESDMLCVLTDISSKIYFIGRRLISSVLS
jgi:hypothetical protein